MRYAEIPDRFKKPVSTTADVLNTPHSFGWASKLQLELDDQQRLWISASATVSPRPDVIFGVLVVRLRAEKALAVHIHESDRDFASTNRMLLGDKVERLPVARILRRIPDFAGPSPQNVDDIDDDIEWHEFCGRRHITGSFYVSCDGSRTWAW